MKNLKDKIYNYITEAINKNKDSKTFAEIDNKEIIGFLKLKDTEENKKEVYVLIGELMKDKKLFYHKEENEKISFEGTRVSNIKLIYFNDFNKFSDYKKNFIELNKSKMLKKNEKQLKALETLNTLSENSKIVYSALNEILEKESKVYVEDKELYNNIYEKINMEFNDFLDAKKELTDNKVIYIIPIQKENKETNEIETKYVIMSDSYVLNKVMRREEFKKSNFQKKESEVKIEEKPNKWDTKNKESKDDFER